MSSQDGQQNEQNQITPANQSAKTAAGAAIGALIMVGEYAWDKVDGKQEPKTEKTEEKTDVKNNKQTTDDKQVKQEPKAQDQSQGNNPIIAALKGTEPSNNQGRQASALPSNNNSPFVGGGRG